jgi:hypothetical protein
MQGEKARQLLLLLLVFAFWVLQSRWGQGRTDDDVWFKQMECVGGEAVAIELRTGGAAARSYHQFEKRATSGERRAPTRDARALAASDSSFAAKTAPPLSPLGSTHTTVRSPTN